MIPRQLLFGAPEITCCRVSPDGRRLAWLAPQRGIPSLWIAPIDAPEAAGPLMTPTPRGISWFAWAGTSRHLLFQQDHDGDENWRLCSIDIETDRVIALTDHANARCYAIEGDAVVVGTNDRDLRWHDVYRVDVATGVRQLLLENTHQLFGFVCDRNLMPRFALRAEMTGRTIVRVDDRSPWRAIAAEDELSTWLVGLDRDARTLYAVTSEGRDTAALVAYDVASAEATVLWHDPTADIAHVVCDLETGVPLAARADGLRPQWLGDGVKPVVDVVGPVCEVVSQSRDGRVWIVGVNHPAEPPTYYLVRDGQIARWRSSRPALAVHQLAEMRAFQVRARDGLELAAYLSAPPGRALPMVLWVHGGPWRRNDFAFSAIHQWLVDRGYAALSVNFRGSTGVGKAFVNAGDREWGRKMHHDLLDAIAHVTAEGLVDPTRIAIAGGSYGGYAALVGMTTTPEVFACGISICGMANLVTSQATKPAYWAPVLEMRARRIGDPRTEEGRALLRERSPLTHAAQLRRPLLVAHGNNDARVSRAESDAIVEAARHNHVPVTYLVYRDEGHGIDHPAANASLYAVIEAFLAQHLGGDAEPIDDALEGVAVEITGPL